MSEVITVKDAIDYLSQLKNPEQMRLVSFKGGVFIVEAIGFRPTFEAVQLNKKCGNQS